MSGDSAVIIASAAAIVYTILAAASENEKRLDRIAQLLFEMNQKQR